MHTLYRDLLALRRRHDVLRRGDMELVDVDGAVMRFDRRLDDEVITVLVNFSDETLPWPADLSGVTVLLSTTGDRQAKAMVLGPNEAVVLQIRSK